ncbi:MAG: urease subunit beta [Rikenellaceae bacterium]
MIPGELFIKEGDITLNEGRRTATLEVVNTGDRPIQVGSHIHFFEVNKALAFDREEAFGMRLNIPAGTAVRFEAGEQKSVEIVELGGKKLVIGVNNLANGASKAEAVENMKSKGFKTL